METYPLYNLDLLKVTTADDDEFLHKILTTFLTNNREMMRKVKEGLTVKNYVVIGECAHKMLGSYKHLEVNFLDSTLTDLEGMAMGRILQEEDIVQKVAFLEEGSEKVFSGIESEIAQIKLVS